MLVVTKNLVRGPGIEDGEIGAVLRNGLELVCQAPARTLASDSREASHNVPVHTPEAPRQSAAARCRPEVTPPAAITGVSPAMAATSGTIENVPIGPVCPAAS